MLTGENRGEKRIKGHGMERREGMGMHPLALNNFLIDGSH